MTTRRSDNSDVFVCDAVLDIGHIGALREELEKLLADSHSVEMDASAVERVDTAALQLLTVFARAAQRRGIALTWRNTSDVFKRSAVLVGLDRDLGLSQVRAT
jgi:phospholipid transport system transporter-binding protein